MENAGVFTTEISTLRLDPIDKNENIEDLIINSITTGVDYVDHYTTLSELENSIGEQTKDSRSYVTIYDCSNHFNYISDEYESQVGLVSELVIPPYFQNVMVEDFKKMDSGRSPFVLTNNRSKNIVVPQNGSGSSLNLEKFPYYNELKIVSKVNNKFCKFIQDIDIFDDFLGSYVNGEKTEVEFNIEQNQDVSEAVSTPIFDLSSWLQSPSFSVLDGYYPYDEKSLLDSDMIKNYKKLLLSGYFRNISISGFRSFEDILSGVESYREDFVYSVEKWANVPVGAALQTFYIPAIKDSMKLHDTQIMHGKRYIYRCTAHYIIVGNKYRYENLQIKYDGDVPYVNVDVINMPNIVIAPIELFQKDNLVLQRPPMVPQVRFVTENNSSKKINIYLSATGGKMESFFQKIFPEDEKQASDLTILGNQIIHFQDYDESAEYEIYKSLEPPKSYADFTKQDNIRMPFITSDAVYVDSVIPNRKLYYMFRKLNSKGLVSNPTTIYEVELVIDADDSKVIVDRYEFPKPVIKQNSKTFRELFQILPSIEQVLFDDEQPITIGKNSLRGTIDNLTLGVETNSVWGRRFKFRFRSTTTGKLLDCNVTFKLTKNKSKEDF
jgi:hypothetical protein